jgi:hypothetical protein
MGILKTGGILTMLKKWSFITTIAITLSLSFFLVPNKEVVMDVKEAEMDVISINANYIQSTTLEQLENNSDLIVIAKTTQPFLNRNHVIKHMKDSNGKDLPSIMDMFTRTEIVIEKVIKQPNNEAFSKDDRIQIIEPISYDDLRKVKVTLAHYEEINANESYILFLGKNTYGNYSLINMNNGKFKINKLKSNKQEDQLNYLHNKLAKEVYAKYKEKYIN